MFHRICSLLLLSAPLAAATHVEMPASHQVIHKHVQGSELKSWYDQNRAMVVLDARTKPYFDGNLLPGAKWVPFDTHEKDILSIIPSKDSLVVVYCSGVNCPASGWLYDKLAKLGFTNVYEYHEGIHDWMDRGHPTDRQK